MDESGNRNSELEQLLEEALQSLECGRLDETVGRLIQLLRSSQAIGDKQFEGEALYYLHILDGGLSPRKPNQLKEE